MDQNSETRILPAAKNIDHKPPDQADHVEGQIQKQIDQKFHESAIHLNNDLVYAPA